MNAGPLTHLGRYELVRVLGRGAMGLVYEGRDPRLGRKVAIKTILKTHLADPALAREYSSRFVREAQAAARLAHPNIVTVHDFGEDDEVSYLVMEFIEGRELAQLFDERTPFDLASAVRIVCDLLEALAYAHDHGVVHRDVKPANVMIDRAGRVKLTDFGVARLVDSNADRTLPGTMVGTPSYMSPEQVQGLAVGSRTDLFAVGIVLYQFLTGSRPFSGGGPWEIQRQIVHDQPRAPSAVNPALPTALDAVMQRALAKDPHDRYPDARTFAADLQQAAGVAAAPDASGSAAPADRGATSTPRSPAGSGSYASGAAPDDTRSAATVPIELPRARSPAAPTHAAGPTAPPASPSGDPTVPIAGPAPPEGARRWRWAGLLALAGAAGMALLWSRMPADPSVGAPSASMPASAARAAAPGPSAATSRALPITSIAPAASPVPGTTSAPAEQAAPGPQGVAIAASARATPADSRVTSVTRPAPDRKATVGGIRPGGDAATRPAQPGNRCAELLERLQLGEELSPENLQMFQKECKR